MIIETHAYARAGLLGNPSDGYFGKTISIIVANFGAHVLLYETPELKIESSDSDRNVYKNAYELVERIGSLGYYGGDRLIKAAIRKFFTYCIENNIKLDYRNFSIRYNSSIPRQVGLGGSSAIVTATMRALMKFFKVTIPKEFLPSLILAAEVDELGINAGLQDRVIQVYEGCVYMDFNREIMEQKNHGIYIPLDKNKLPKLYLAYKTSLSKVSGQSLNDIKVRYERGDPEVIACLSRIAELAEEGKAAIENGDEATLNRLINENFDNRKKIMTISESNQEMIDVARECGASAKFAGSGGSIIGIYKDDAMLNRLIVNLKKINARVIKPYIV